MNEINSHLTSVAANHNLHGIPQPVTQEDLNKITALVKGITFPINSKPKGLDLGNIFNFKEIPGGDLYKTLRRALQLDTSPQELKSSILKQVNENPDKYYHYAGSLQKLSTYSNSREFSALSTPLNDEIELAAFANLHHVQVVVLKNDAISQVFNRVLENAVFIYKNENGYTLLEPKEEYAPLKLDTLSEIIRDFKAQVPSKAKGDKT